MPNKLITHAAAISVSNQGSVFLFRPLTDAARLHLEECCPDGMWFAGALVCERRYAQDFAVSLGGNGFVIK